MFPFLACVVAAATFTQLLAFTVMGERLTTRLRGLAFRNIVRQVIDLIFARGFDDGNA